MRIREFLKAEDTEFGLRVVLGGGIPLFLFYFLGHPDVGLMMMVGSTFISGIDIPAELPRKLRLMTFSLISTPIVFMTIAFCHPYPVLFYPVLAAFIFLFAFIAPFSFHFGKVAFMSNLAIMLSLSFVSTLSNLIEIFYTASLLFTGGLWYMIFASLMHFIQRPMQVTRRVSDVLARTADYFTTRSHLFDPNSDRENIALQLAEKQASLTDAHEKVRALLMKDFDYPRLTHSRLGRMLHFFASLVDLFDEALATSWKLQETAELLENPQLQKSFGDINESIATILQMMEAFLNNEMSMSDLQQSWNQLEIKSQEVRQKMELMRHKIGNRQESSDTYHAFKPIQIYIAEQMDTLEYMIMILQGKNDNLAPIKAKDLPYFETRDRLRMEQIRTHLTFRSGYFRYALRVVVTAMSAYFLIRALGFQNANWALFTVLVILKPGYRVSQKRLVWRVLGTTLGVLSAYGLFFVLEPGQFLSSVVFLIAFFGGFAFMTSNYTIASGFFTVYILFLYAFLDRNMETSAFFRFSNTLLAAILSVFSIRLLFPFWENRSVTYYLTHTLHETRNYLREIYQQLRSPGFDLTSYRLARKDAHLAMGVFIHAYQRILSEPKNKRGNTDELKIWIHYTSSCLAVCSNIGIFLRREPNYRLDQNGMGHYFEWILQYFDHIIHAVGKEHQSSYDEESLNKIHDLKKKHHRLQKQINHLASGYSEVYISTIHEYFLVHEMITLYHLLERMEDITYKSAVLSGGTANIAYS